MDQLVWGSISQILQAIGLAIYAVYRRNASGEDEHYELVSRIFSAVRANDQTESIESDRVDGGIQTDGFVCYNDSAGDPPVTVRAGDIVGVVQT